jgi:hypothetical protein
LTVASWFSICASLPSTQLLTLMVHRLTLFMKTSCAQEEQGPCQPIVL